MDRDQQKLFLFLVFLGSVLEFAESGFNAVYLKQTNATLTCGNPPEEFFETQQGFISSIDRVPFTCNASDPARAYPPENMVDGLLGTHWQSSAGEDLAFITISFEQAFFAQHINITFGNYRRPGAIKVEKSTDFGATFTPWHYLVTSPARRQCSVQFGVDAFQGLISRVDQVLCTEYIRYVPPEYNETISIELNQKQRGDGSQDSYTPGLQAWMNATAVKFSFSNLFRKFDVMAKMWHHYTVREIEVTGRCDCKGHADGNHCPLNQGFRACQCEGNTCGVHCDECCPIYNQFPWKIGNGAPWTNDPAAKCEPCNCHNHADTCMYNQTVSDLGLSMSINGSMIGGGVCLDCQHNTQGINCEKCEDYFYRPMGKNQTDADACNACNCNTNGTANVSSLSFGDCVRDENELSIHPGKQPGDCYCKVFVRGRQCDTCQAGYYRLTQDNPHGCIACDCYLNGTIGRSHICQGDYDGQCSCKSNVDLRDCSQCKDGYYDLQDSDINGCKSCACDVGGTASGQTCDKATGVCHCRPHVIGKFCNRTESGFYNPDAFFINAAKSPYKPATYTLYVLLDIPKTGNYRLLFKYINGLVKAHTQAAVQFKNTSASGQQDEQIFVFSQDSLCTDCQEQQQTTMIQNEYLLMKKGQWMVNITTRQPYGQLKLYAVIAIPKEFIEASVLGADQSEKFLFFCSVEGNDMSSDPQCIPSLRSITMDFINGTLACDCHPLGSSSSICEEYAGQCSCKPGVEGRDCSRCKPGFYNLTESGCIPCGCNGPNKVCDVTTGECECPENTVGRTCLPCQCNNNTDRCLRTGECLGCQSNTTGFSCQHCDNGSFGNALNQACNACACSAIGSLDQSCDRVSGQCNCKTKVTGRNCTLCEVNTFNFGPSGCEDCGCNTFGSASLQCLLSGQCLCQANVTGTKCTQCTSGFYGLPDGPCRECDCNATGAIPGSLCTNDTAGQCQCKPGVTGRSCDQCMKFFTNFSYVGCEACSMCIQNLRRTIVNNSYTVNVTNAKVQVLKDLTYFNEPMVEVSRVLREAKVEREHFYARISEGNQLYQEFVTSKVPEANNSLKELSIRARDLRGFSKEAAVNTTNILDDIIYAKNATLSARQYVTSVDDIIGDVRKALGEYNAAASQVLADSTEAWHQTRDRNFTQYSRNINESIRMAENVSAYAEQTLTRVISKLFSARELEVSVQEKAANFNQIQESWNQSHALFMNEIEQVYNHSMEIQATLMETKNLLDEELLALNSTKSSLEDTNETLNDTRNVLLQGTAIFEKYHSTLIPVNGELEVSMLQYEQAQTQFVMRIEKGRNLPPKDLSSQTSDPYVLVSTVPDWNNEGTQKSTTVNGELNPDFPFADLFRFTITMEQLNYTKLKLAVHDHDPGDEDDFLGVVLIDLSKVGDFFDNIITKWYPLLPQDLSGIGSGNFVPSSGLTDVTNLLASEVDKIKQKLAITEITLHQAQNHASYLESLAHQMEQTFNHSRSHGAPALSAIQRYHEINELVNRSLDLVEQANNTMNIIYQQLSVISLHDLQISAEKMSQGFYDLYNDTLERNITVQDLGKTIHEANITFINSQALWNGIYDLHPAILDAADNLQIATAGAPDVLPPLNEAQNEVTNTNVLLFSLEAQLIETEAILDALLNKTAVIKESSNDGITMINDAFTNVQNISAKLTPNPVEPPVNATVRDAKAAMDLLPSIRYNIETGMDNVSSKLDHIRSMVASLPFALHLVNDGLVMLVPSRRTIENPLTDEISFDIKTNVSEGLVMYIGDLQNQTTGRSDSLTNSLAIYLSGNTVNVIYNLGDGPILGQNPVVLENDMWYNVYFTRFGAEAFLTVSADTPHSRDTVMINGSSLGGNTTLQLTNQSAIYLGGLPANLTDSRLFGHFSGIIDNLVIKNERYNLWNPKETRGGTLYAFPRYKVIFYPANGKAVSFYGNGFIQHALGQFDISSEYTAVELDFRTLHQNGIIMAVSNEQQIYIFVIYLHNGRVNFYFDPGPNDGITLTSSRSSYGNGRWYGIRVVRTSVNATLVVNPVGSRETPDSHYVDTGETAMDSGHVITFGALIPNSVSNFVVTDVFSGDMKNLLLYSSASASLIPRYFNDPVLMIAKQGVSFHGVIRGKIEHGTRFYGYQEQTGDCSYASIDVSNEIATLSTLTFTFKTKEQSGVLFYSGDDIQGAPSLYLALLHGDLLLLLGDIKTASVFSSSNITFYDNSWYVIHLQLSGNGYALHVNNTLLHTGMFDFVASPLVLRKPFYMGGIPFNKSSQVPFALCFKGGMKNLVIDSSSVSFFSGHILGVSYAGVIPARVPPPIPPSCSVPLLPPTASNNAGTVHFDVQGGKGTGYIGFELDETQRNKFKYSFVVSLAFRALSDDGVLLYATDNDTHPTQFFSMELVEGRLLYEFNSGVGLVSISTTQKYSGNGHWFGVHILWMSNFGAILASTREYVNGRHDPPGLTMNLRRLYIGGLPSHVIAPSLTNRYLSFAGCIKDFEVAEANTSLFNLNKPDLTGSNDSRGSCYDKAQPGLGFNGSAWARFDNFNLSAEFNIQLTFRTSSRDGLLFVISGNSTSAAGNRMHVRLEQSSGQMILTYNTTTNESRVVWTEPGLGNDTQSSYLMCQMTWHSVRVTKQGSNMTITLDELYSVSRPVTYGTNMTGELFFGGYPANQMEGDHTVSVGFKGCLKKFNLDGNVLHFAQAADLSQVSTACPLTSSETESALKSEQ